MTRLLIDTSVVIKWFHSDRETEIAEARALRAAHMAGNVDALIIDLALYELGNILIRALKWSAADVADQFEDLTTILGAPLSMSPDWLRQAATLAESHRLTFYDASWAAAALELEIPLVSADRQLINAGLAESATDAVARLRLPL